MSQSMQDTTPMQADGASHTVNGVDVQALMTTVRAIAADPGLGACRFRASNTWSGGTHNRSSVTGFYGARQELAHRQPFHMDADEPPILAGGDEGANPVEHLLHALASCVTTSMVAHAASRGIEVQSVESELEGDIDLNGFLGLDESVPRGFTDIRVRFRVEAAEADLPRLAELTRYSPVFNTITQGARVDISVDRR